MDKAVRYAAIGLARAMDAGVDADAARLLLNALRLPTQEAVAVLHGEKERLAPDCVRCQHPCGRHDDYTQEREEADAPEVAAAKQAAWDFLLRLDPVGRDPEAVVRLVFYLGEDWVAPDDLQRAIDALRA